MKYELDKRIFLNDKYIQTQSIVLVQRAYRTKYKSKTAPSATTILNIAKNYKQTGSVDRKRIVGKKKTAHTSELVKSIENIRLVDDDISSRKIASPASASTIRKAKNIKPKK